MNHSSSSLSFEYDFETSYRSHTLCLNDEANNMVDIPSFLRPDRKRNNRGARKDTRSCDVSLSSMSLSSTAGSDFDFDVDDIDESDQVSQASHIKSYFIPGITARARCLQGSKSSSSTISSRRKVGMGSKRQSIDRSCSSSTVTSKLSRDIHQLIAKNLDGARNLLGQQNSLISDVSIE